MEVTVNIDDEDYQALASLAKQGGTTVEVLIYGMVKASIVGITHFATHPGSIGDMTPEDLREMIDRTDRILDRLDEDSSDAKPPA